MPPGRCNHAVLHSGLQNEALADTLHGLGGNSPVTLNGVVPEREYGISIYRDILGQLYDDILYCNVKPYQELRFPRKKPWDAQTWRQLEIPTAEKIMAPGCTRMVTCPLQHLIAGEKNVSNL